MSSKENVSNNAKEVLESPTTTNHFPDYAHSSGRSSVLCDQEPIRSLISDAGVYSMVGLYSISLRHLFPGPWDRPFCEKTIKTLIDYLKMPPQILNSMIAILDGEGGDLNAFINLLRKEPALRTSALRIVEELILFAVQEGIYDARSRILILYVAELLQVPVILIEVYEESVVEMLSHELPIETPEELKDRNKRELKKKLKRWGMIGLASVGGGTIIGLTGGLAAPLVAIGAGAILGTAGATILGSAALVGSLFGVAGAGLTGYKMKKRVGDIEEFAFDVLTPGPDLRLTIAISGWLTDEGPDAFIEPWRSLINSKEQYAIRYESSYLLELGRAFEYILSFAVSMAAQEALKYTVLSGLLAAIAWPVALLSASSVIDNPWGVCCNRSVQVGRHLAEVLLSRQQGKRPVTLIGFSLGCRVIYACLEELAKRKGSEGIIEDVILLGGPISGSADHYKPFARIVSGKIINGYSRGDWLLKFLYRTSSAAIRIAGLQPIDWKDRRMQNVDLSHLVSGHMDYRKKMPLILREIGIRTRADQLFPMTTLRKCNSDMPGLASHAIHSLQDQYMNRTIMDLASSEANLTRSHSEPAIAGLDIATEAVDFDYLALARRRASVGSVPRSLTPSSGVVFSPHASSPDFLSQRSGLSSPERHQ